MVKVENMVAVENVETSSILGHLTWYSVGNNLIDEKELESKLVQTGLPKSWMPNSIRSVDAFRRATKEVETKRTVSANIYENYLIREVYSDKEVVQRNIVCEVVDQSGKRLDYKSDAGIVRLDKKNDSLIFETENDFVKEMCKEIQGKFDIYKNHYSSQQLRVMVSKILNSLAPVPVRPNGGVYFVPNSHTEGLKQLVNFASSLDNSEMFKVPVVNSLENKNMVVHKLNDHIEDVLKQCSSSDGLKKGVVKEIINDAKKLVEDYKNYQTFVDLEKGAVEEKMELLRKEISRLIVDIS